MGLFLNNVVTTYLNYFVKAQNGTTKFLAKQVNRNPSLVIGAVMFVTAIMFTILITAPEAGDPSQSGFIPENEVVDAMTDIGEKFRLNIQLLHLLNQ